MDREEPLVRAVLSAAPSGLRELGVAALTAIVLFPPFALAFAMWHGPVGRFDLTLPESAWSFWLGHLVVVGLPEEAFFRGYVQTRLTEAFPRTRRVCLTELSVVAWLLQATLFALVHFVVDLDPARLAVFFPALVFGWLRAFRGGIGAAIVFHAACNFFQAVLVQSWLRP